MTRHTTNESETDVCVGGGMGILNVRYAYEAPDAIAARARAPKVSEMSGTNQVYVVGWCRLTLSNPR